jgi:DNA-binding CsgD family transcriptional regulator
MSADSLCDAGQQFDSVKQRVQQCLEAWFVGDRGEPPDLEQFSVPVYLKNQERFLTLVNQPYQAVFSGGELPVGRHSDEVLNSTFSNISIESDALLMQHYTKIEFDHVGRGAGGKRFLFRTFKADLTRFRYPPYAIVGVTAPISQITTAEGSRDEVEALYQVYTTFSAIDQQICTLFAVGESTRAIAERLNVSTKTVENHRNQVLRKLGFSKPVEIIRLLVRFEERGLMDDFSRHLR